MNLKECSNMTLICLLSNSFKRVSGCNRILLQESNITADGDCSHKIRRHLCLGRIAVTNLDSVLKSRDITLPTKVHIVKAMVFLVVMYGCVGREGCCKQITLVCVGSALPVSATLGLPPLTVSMLSLSTLLRL